MDNVKKTYRSMDGNEAAAYGSYAFTEVAGIYPITPSSTMAEHVDVWASKGMKSVFGNPVKVVEMQSEAGASGTVHGALQGGSLATTYTASQGLLLMIPNIYKWVGELLPGVLHVSARAIATRSLSIFGDHQDIYAVRQTGIPMMCSHSVQEVADLAPLAHLIAIKASAPVLHFFDGFRTSHEIQKVELLDYSELEKLLDKEALANFRKRALDPRTNPVTRGGAENDDIYFQGREAQNNHYANVVDVADYYFKEISKLTGRHYAPFTYYGDPNATKVIVAMGSVTETIKETIDALGKGYGLVKVHLYRPFSAKHLLSVLPNTIKRIAVLDRTKEMGSEGEPLYLDVYMAVKEARKDVEIIGGRYGLSSKDTQPNQIKAVFDNLGSEKPLNHFTVGIEDDVTHLSLPVDNNFHVEGDYTSCLFYGLGSDGTVSANKNSIKIIGDHTDKYIQAYFAYDSKKAGGATRSNLRFGNSPIRSTYYIKNADFISCSLDSYLFKYDMLNNLKKNGTFLLNTTFSKEEIVSKLPNRVKKELAERNAKFYIINATKLAEEIGMGRRTNTILQSAFFKLNPSIMNYDDALRYMKEAAKKAYSKKGEHIVELNYKAIDIGGQAIELVEVDPSWKDLVVKSRKEEANDKYFDYYIGSIETLNGYDLPVSTFTEMGLLDGSMHNDVTYKEKRNIAAEVPVWNKENCIQCGKCVFVCPHATIRAFLLDENEVNNAPDIVKNDLADVIGGPNVKGLKYRIQVSPANCVGCGLCVTECPGKGGNKALTMVDVKTQVAQEAGADYLYKHIKYKANYFPITTVKGASFLRPYFEVSGACAGCGETPYYRLATQLFGKDMIIANATGCSSIYCGSTPATPFATDENGEGPAWANSLFEDNAEYGFGMRVATNYRLENVANILESSLDEVEDELKALIEEYLSKQHDIAYARSIKDKLIELVKASKSSKVKEVLPFEKDIVDKSVWIVGGDGWAYDIGFGGLDHVLASNENVNVLVLDTEVYSNTGGQASKSTQTGAIAKFAAAGKKTAKKDLAAIAMSYGHVYVAQVSMGANPMQLIKAMQEAASYNGPSLIIAYAPCAEHGIKGGLSNHQLTQKAAVECGYTAIYRYDPRLKAAGKNPLTIDYKTPDFNKFRDFVLSELRFNQLPIVNKEHAEELLEQSRKHAEARFARLTKLAQD
ncbi:MAG: pyruvate:ferredoxin (flavodoxin) oxidoreductase [Bacilli bacterium]|nr:pyruvate:ferredoxin (flavodoxin) oxidoreductase [Bacilli bacterium]